MMVRAVLRRLAPALFLTTILAAALACGRSAPATSSPKEASPTVVESTAAPVPTESTVGTSLDSPVPAGGEFVIDDIAIQLQDVVYPADDLVQSGDDLNPTPEPSEHYLVLTVHHSCQLPSGETCHMLGQGIRVIDSDGEVHYPILSLQGVQTPLPSESDILGGESTDFQLSYLVPAASDTLTLRYEWLFGEEIFFALE